MPKPGDRFNNSTKNPWSDNYKPNTQVILKLLRDPTRRQCQTKCWCDITTFHMPTFCSYGFSKFTFLINTNRLLMIRQLWVDLQSLCYATISPTWVYFCEDVASLSILSSLCQIPSRHLNTKELQHSKISYIKILAFYIWTYWEPVQTCWPHRRGTACGLKSGWVCVGSVVSGGEGPKALWGHKQIHLVYTHCMFYNIFLGPYFLNPSLYPMHQVRVEQDSCFPVEKP